MAVLLAGATYLSLAHLRYQGLFACLAVTLGGTVLSGVTLPEWSARTRRIIDSRLGHGSLGSLGLARLVLLAGMLLLVMIRGADLAWNRYYLFAGQTSLFGPGVSWWYPERATAFLLRERLPGNIFNDYNLGGYLTWRIGPAYPDYVDGRVIPFGAPFLTHQRDLMQQQPDSPEWQREADLRNINTILVSVARYGGLGSFPLQQFCASEAWRPVYLDEVAAIFVRNRPENAAWINHLRIDCATVRIDPPATVAMGSRARQNGELFNFYANAGSVLYVLGRGADALRYLQSAETIFPDDSNLHLTLGQLFQSYNRWDLAEQEYRTSVELRPTDMGWYLLGRLYIHVQRYEDSAQAFDHAADLSYQACDRYLDLGELYVQMQRPEEALKAFARAVRLSPYPRSSPWGSSFYARVAAADPPPPASTATIDGQRVLFRRGEAWSFGAPDSACVIGTAAISDGALQSPMPGRIVSVSVHQGQVVTKGQTLVSLEAMKMEHALIAPFDGTVGELSVSVGDQVAENMTLVRIIGDLSARQS